MINVIKIIIHFELLIFKYLIISYHVFKTIVLFVPATIILIKNKPY